MVVTSTSSASSPRASSPTAQDQALDAVTRLPELDADELAGLALPGTEEAGQRPETWVITL
jgi:hypothetical protein